MRIIWCIGAQLQHGLTIFGIPRIVTTCPRKLWTEWREKIEYSPSNDSVVVHCHEQINQTDTVSNSWKCIKVLEENLTNQAHYLDTNASSSLSLSLSSSWIDITHWCHHHEYYVFKPSNDKQLLPLSMVSPVFWTHLWLQLLYTINNSDTWKDKKTKVYWLHDSTWMFLFLCLFLPLLILLPLFSLLSDWPWRARFH